MFASLRPATPGLLSTLNSQLRFRRSAFADLFFPSFSLPPLSVGRWTLSVGRLLPSDLRTRSSALNNQLSIINFTSARPRATSQLSPYIPPPAVFFLAREFQALFLRKRG